MACAIFLNTSGIESSELSIAVTFLLAMGIGLVECVACASEKKAEIA